MTTVWNGRMAALQAAGVPAAISWSQGLLKRDAWGIPKGAKNKANAMKFAAYSTMAIPQARVALAIPYGSVNNKSNEYIPPERLEVLPSAPDIKSQLVNYNYDWWIDNREAVDQPFQQMAAELTAMNGAGRGASVSLTDLEKSYDRVAAVDGVSLDIRSGEFLTLLGPERLGQDHDPDDDRGLRDADRRRHRHRRQVGRRHAALPPQHRHGVPELRAVPASDGRREHRLPAEAARRAEGGARRSWSARRSSWSICRATARAIRASSPAASSSAWRSPAPSSSSRACC